MERYEKPELNITQFGVNDVILTPSGILLPDDTNGFESVKAKSYDINF
jgi:hypothetical protein